MNNNFNIRLMNMNNNLHKINILQCKNVKNMSYNSVFDFDI